jgi:hypothetical protein
MRGLRPPSPGVARGADARLLELLGRQLDLSLGLDDLLFEIGERRLERGNPRAGRPLLVGGVGGAQHWGMVLLE